MVLRPQLDECVHCGFCLPACPTYVLDGQETDSPRGRIHLMDLVARGEVPLDRAVTRHIDSCLGCLGCVTACPSGVRYDQLITATRPLVEQRAPRGRRERLFRAAVFSLFPYPGRLRAASLLGLAYQRLGWRALVRRLGLLGRLSERLRTLAELLPPMRLRALLWRPPRYTPAAGHPRRRVVLLAGCVQRVLFSQVTAATIRVLAAEGCEVLVPTGQGCCGALSLHSGRPAEAARSARRLIAALEGWRADVVVTDVAGCGSALKEYGDLLADDPAWRERATRLAGMVRDVTELLAELPPRAPRHPLPVRVAYHDACHLRHAQRVVQPPRQLLATIPGLALVEPAEAELCCGSAGVYNLLQPATAAQLGRRKAAHLRESEPDLVATANAGCLLQIGRFLPGVPLRHPVELLDASIRGTSP